MTDPISDKKCVTISQREFDAYKKSEREYLDKCVEVVSTRFEANDKALKLADEEAKRQYDRLNHLREEMLPKAIYNEQHENLKKEIDRTAKIVYIGLGIVLAMEFIIRVFWKG